MQPPIPVDDSLIEAPIQYVVVAASNEAGNRIACTFEMELGVARATCTCARSALRNKGSAQSSCGVHC